MNINDKKDIILDQYNSIKSIKEQKYSEGSQRVRNSYQRDYSRILYSSSFRRLQGKMQLMGIDSMKFYRNRLTHSLEVSQIARGIVEKVREDIKESIYIDDIYVVEACSIAHDIGNPPFGHYGESVLNKLTNEIGGFEGNAQTIKIVTKLEKKLPNHKGLNLTYRTQLGLIKYFNKRLDNSKKFIYDENYEEYKKIMNEYTNIYPRTLDVQIIDLADEIAYAAHDLEDALSLHLFTIDEFMYEFKLYIKEKIRALDSEAVCCKYNDAIEEMENIVNKAREVADSAINYRSSEEYSHIFRKEIISNLVNKLINDIDIAKINDNFRSLTGTYQQYELQFIRLGELANGLKKYTFQCINRNNDVLIYEKIGEKVIKGLYEVFTDKVFNKDGMLLPAEFRQLGDKEDSIERCSADYIAGMMDMFAIKTYKKYYGENSLDKIYN
jgi:dGTPase